MISTPNKAWLKDGILYSEIHGTVTLDDLVDLQRQGVELIKLHNIGTAPNINIMTDAKGVDFKIKLSEFGKVITSIDTIKHASGIWIVGADEELRKRNEHFIKLFFGGGIGYVDTLEQAEAEARKLLGNDLSVLEQG
jgi:hypothetical protein